MLKIIKKVVCVFLIIGILSANVAAANPCLGNVLGINIPQQIIDELGLSGKNEVLSVQLVKSISDKGHLIINSQYIDKKCRESGNGTVVIPKGVHCLCQDAFKNFTAKNLIIEGQLDGLNSNMFSGTGIESIVIKTGPLKLEEGAFQNCPKLKMVVLPDVMSEGVDMAVIPDRLFYNCPKLEEVRLFKNTSLINKEAFKGCVSLKNC